MYKRQAVLKVGAATEAELKEKKSRIEDALQATRAAVEEGIVAGGGVALINAIPALDTLEITDADEKVGVEIIRKAMEAPMRAIAPVSYTHLDVYKRQAASFRARRRRTRRRAAAPWCSWRFPTPTAGCS